MSAVSAAENRAVLLDAVSHHMAAAVSAGRRQCVNRTFERIERVPLAGQFDDKSLVVLVAANFAFHDTVLRYFVRANGVPVGRSKVQGPKSKVDRSLTLDPGTLDFGLGAA